MLENVPGLMTTSKGKRYFRELRRGLQDAGYQLSHEVVELADYGVPQLRKRLVLVAARSGRVSIPEPTHRHPNRVDGAGQYADVRLISFADRLQDRERFIAAAIIHEQKMDIRCLGGERAELLDVETGRFVVTGYNQGGRAGVTFHRAGVL